MEQTKSGRTVSWGEVLTYASGGMFVLGFQLVVVSYYVNFFMTDILMIPTLMAATFNVIINITKTVTMALGGVIMDRTNFKRGNISTWYFICNIGLAITLPLTFIYLGFEPVVAGIWFVVFYTLQIAFYNTSWVAIRAIGGIIGKTNEDNMWMTSTTNSMAGIPAMLWPYLQPFVFGIPLWAGTKNVYFGFCLISAVVIIIGGWVILRTSGPKEVARLEAMKAAGIVEVKKDKKEEKIPMSVMLKSLKGPGLIYLLAQTFSCMQSGFFSVLLTYYATYVLGDPSITTSTIAITSISTIIGNTIVPVLARRFSKRVLFIGYQAILCVLYLALIPVGNNGVGFIVLRSLQTFVSSVNLCVVSPFMTEIGDYYEMNGGANARGFLQSMAGTATRLGGSITSIFTGYALAWIGYQAGQPVSASTANGITMLMVVGPALFAALACITMLFYKVDEKAVDAYRIKRDSGMAQ